jgi:FO synthase subunit 2
LLDTEEIVRRAVQAHELGATEVCLQAGLAPAASGHTYLDILRAIKAAAPALHIHALSPEEVKYGARRARMSVRAYLESLLDAGLGSLPGTAAEILDDRVRAQISPGRITTAEWLDVVRSAHALGLPTTATMMFGHVETFAERAAHMALLRELQAETGGFTEFVPLSFVAAEAPLPIARGPSEQDVLRTFAIARLMLGAHIPNLQVSWVKQGLELAARLLAAGANDLGGTLMNESISTTAGAGHGQCVTPSALRRAIERAGREPWQRTTLYARVAEPSGAPLDAIADPDQVFGSYDQLARDPRFRYEPSRDQIRRAIDVEREPRAVVHDRAQPTVALEAVGAPELGREPEVA